MNRQLWLASAVALAAATPAVCETAPKNVTYAEGAVEASLSGAPGNPEEGVKVMTTNALGNCVACHQIAALPDVQFPGISRRRWMGWRIAIRNRSCAASSPMPR